MVYVPFLNIDLPEPSLRDALPDAVTLAVHGTARLLETFFSVVAPWSTEHDKAREAAWDASLPREFDRVRKRMAEGKVYNEEQISSELEDAAFDWYRRQLRTAAMGGSEEDFEDVSRRKLGMPSTSAQALAQAEFLQEQEEDAATPENEALYTVLLAAQQKAEKQKRQQVEALESLASLRSRVRTGRQQTTAAIRNVSGGLLLGVFALKSALLLSRKLLSRKPSKPSAKPSQRAARQAAAAASPAAPAAAKPPAAPAAASKRPTRKR
jgi:hypothetical protein